MNKRNDRATWIKGDGAQCSIPPKPRLQPPRLVLIGAPGTGQGTQAEYLCASLGVCHLAINDIFRAAKFWPDAEQTDAMIAALTQMQHGQTVADATVLDLVRERTTCLRCAGGFLLDGFPQNVRQAAALDGLLEHARLRLDAALNYKLPFQTMLHRLSGRRTCAECHAVFHVNEHPPLVADVCDYCGGILLQNEEDRPEAIEQRLLAYEQSSKPLLNYYLGHGILRTISAEGTPERICERTLAILDN